MKTLRQWTGKLRLWDQGTERARVELHLSDQEVSIVPIKLTSQKGTREEERSVELRIECFALKTVLTCKVADPAATAYDIMEAGEWADGED